MLRCPTSQRPRPSSAARPSRPTGRRSAAAPSASRRGSPTSTGRSRACRPTGWSRPSPGSTSTCRSAILEAALDEIDTIYLRDAVYFHHPRYLAHLNCPVAIPALLAETILSPINSSLDTWDQSAGGTLIERGLIAWTAARIGLGATADGVFTSGGTQSNLQALYIARDEARHARDRCACWSRRPGTSASRGRRPSSDSRRTR